MLKKIKDSQDDKPASRVAPVMSPLSTALQISYEMPSMNTVSLQEHDIYFNEESFALADKMLLDIEIINPDLLATRKKQSQIFKDKLKKDILIDKEFLPKGTIKVQVISTSSDFHIGAKRVVQIICYDFFDKQIGNVFYKPHDLKAENYLFGNNSVASSLGLPVLPMKESDDHGLVLGVDILQEDIEAKSDLEKEQICFTLGAYLAMSEVYGIGDLHLDNLVASQFGPLIIDGEFSLLPAIIADKTGSCMQLQDIQAITMANKDMYVLKGGLDSYLGYLGIISSEEAIDIVSNPESIRSIPISLYQKIVEGYSRVVQNIDEVTFQDMYKNINSIRFAPLPTSTFASMVREFWQIYIGITNTEEQESRAGIVLNEKIPFIKMITTALQKQGFCINISAVNRDALFIGIIVSLLRGDIPRFTFSPKTNRVLLDNTYTIVDTSIYTPNYVMKIFDSKKRMLLDKINTNTLEEYLLDKYHLTKQEQQEQLLPSVIPWTKIALGTLGTATIISAFIMYHRKHK